MNGESFGGSSCEASFVLLFLTYYARFICFFSHSMVLSYLPHKFISRFTMRKLFASAKTYLYFVFLSWIANLCGASEVRFSVRDLGCAPFIVRGNSREHNPGNMEADHHAIKLEN